MMGFSKSEYCYEVELKVIPVRLVVNLLIHQGLFYPKLNLQYTIVLACHLLMDRLPNQ